MSRCFGACDFFGLPGVVNSGEILRQRLWRATKTDAAGFGGSDAFGLALTNVHALIFSNKAEHLQNDIRQKGADKIFAAPGVEQRHIKHDDIDAAFFGEESPLLEDLSVIAAETIDAFDDEHIVTM